ncbi:hypothetical protein HWV07_06085 [Natronomonas salina]|uniref:DUF7261 family protein n=1 Tax=Natronomonas salina TaxID=1710540 RepID=UPI0015B4C338|nr:hypothetical protein [Natronomonas salina]QLD88624.1 hypothetical protein HWV07_06085 [Natronomonas salina]
MGTWNRDESGQIIIIAALLLAVIFVGLALVLNSAIYTENMATRGDTSTAEAMSVDTVTEDRLQGSIDNANYAIDEDSSYSVRRSRIRQNVSTWNTLMGGREARNGRSYITELNSITNGTRVVQRDTVDFMPADDDLDQSVLDLTIDPLGIEGRTTWLVVTDSEVRDFEMTVEKDSLKQTRQGLIADLVDLTDTALTGSDEFWVQTEGGDEMWRIYLVNDTVNNSVAAVTTELERDGDIVQNETIRSVCSVKGDAATIRFTSGELVSEDDRTDCPALQDAFAPDEYNLYYVGADEVAGSYQFIVDKEEVAFRDSVSEEYEDDGIIGSAMGTLECILTLGMSCNHDVFKDSPNSNEKPYTNTAIYDVSVESTYQDDRITYTRNVTFPPAAR